VGWLVVRGELHAASATDSHIDLTASAALLLEFAGAGDPRLGAAQWLIAGRRIEVQGITVRAAQQHRGRTRCRLTLPSGRARLTFANPT
jgi:hypothetical protein